MFLHTLHDCRHDSACHIEINDWKKLYNRISLERQIPLCFVQVRWPAAAPLLAWKRTLPWVMWMRHSPKMEQPSRSRSGKRQCRPPSARCPLCPPSTILVRRDTFIASIGAAERSFKRSRICQHCPFILSSLFKMYKPSLVSPTEEKLVQKLLLTIDRSQIY